MELNKPILFLRNLLAQRKVVLGLLIGLPLLALAIIIGYYFGVNRYYPRAAQLVSSSKPEHPIIGNRKSRIYHWHGCPNYFDVAPENQVVFATPEDAEKRRFRPAENCSGLPPRSQTR